MIGKLPPVIHGHELAQRPRRDSWFATQSNGRGMGGGKITPPPPPMETVTASGHSLTAMEQASHAVLAATSISALSL
jgi:hypothetical protein